MNILNRTTNRRRFLKGATTTTAGIALMSQSAPSFALPKVSSPNQNQNQTPTTNRATANLKITPQRKALVCIMLDGGNDSFNMLVPTSNQHYAEYKTTRGNLALAKNSLLPLHPKSDTQNGKTFGVHPAMPEVQRLFNQGKLAFIANTAPMVEPTTKASFLDGSARLPVGLFSHADQFKHWQTAQADKRINQGWFGRLADVLQAGNSAKQTPPVSLIPMNISLAGNNILQNGLRSTPYSITQSGSVGLAIERPTASQLARSNGYDETAMNAIIYDSFMQSLNAGQRNDPFKQTYVTLINNSQQQHQSFEKATVGSSHSNSLAFDEFDLAKQLQKVAQSIQASDKLGHQQQTYFIRYRGWDMHDELLSTHQQMLGVLSKALGEFQRTLEQSGIAKRVLTFTGSDFGRTLTSNGNGTDHAWGGNMMVMGDMVNGGQIFGKYPSLSLGDTNPLDVGNGVLIPTTAIESVYAQLATWFGVDDSSLNLLFPNLQRFETMEGLVDIGLDIGSESRSEMGLEVGSEMGLETSDETRHADILDTLLGADSKVDFL